MVPNTIAWSYNSNGLFSVGSFRRCLEEELRNNEGSYKLIWQGWCPPKVELFTCQLLRGRVIVKEVMNRFGYGPQDLSCPFCNDAIETTSHLFLHCRWTWKVWSECLNWWDVSCCSNNSVEEWCIGWQNLCPAPNSIRAWGVAFFAVIWTTWECRNQILFKGAQLGSGGRRTDVWRPPQMDTFKFNVDGSTKGSSGQSGMGGVLRDSSGRVICLFSSYLGIHDANTIEILVVRKACEICALRRDLINWRVVVDSDSKVVVSWVNNEGFGSLKHVNTIYEIQGILRFLSNIEVIYNPRSSNSFADMLAKNGSSQSGDFVFWSDT
ncbi:hypothetical protein Dsin_021328 [Dipteronia sinensis]|uniref:RNase H type-1 domain-containing protein n=1 Tax=Dipteronia sinensis TaxID=43782 RepID=A0AAD9ZZJ0_9ROSI|nr:hypothetical protein Dsin_021328 [Dipteronia sinensis]